MIGFWHDIGGGLGVVAAAAYWALVCLSVLTIVVAAVGLAIVFVGIASVIVGHAWCSMRGVPSSLDKIGEPDESSETAEVARIH